MKSNNNVNRSLSNSVPQSGILQFPGLIFMILYGIFTSDESYYTNDCIDLLLWSKILFYISTIGFIISAFSLPLMYCVLFSLKSLAIFNGFAIFYLGFTFVYMICCMIVFCGISFSFSEDEPCGDLHWLNLGYIIVYAIMITCVCIWGIIVLVVTIVKGKRQKKIKQASSPNKNFEEFHNEI